MADKEQWEYGGDCSKCRRAKYCSKPCREHKRLYGLKVMQTAMAFMATAIEKTMKK